MPCTSASASCAGPTTTSTTARRCCCALAIRRHGRDFELRLRGAAVLSPALARVLEKQYGISLDAASFVALSDDDGTFKPNAVIDQLRRLTGHLGEIAVQPRLVVSTFEEVARRSPRTPCGSSTRCSTRLAGNATAKWALEEGYQAVEPIDPDRREPSTDVLLLDADAEQEHIVAQIAAGNSLVVRTMPGTGATQTIVNALGMLVGQNKRVLVVSPRRAACAASRSVSATWGSRAPPSRRRRCVVTWCAASDAPRRPPSRSSPRSTRRSCDCAACSSTTAKRCRDRTTPSGCRCSTAWPSCRAWRCCRIRRRRRPASAPPR